MLDILYILGKNSGGAGKTPSSCVVYQDKIVCSNQTIIVYCSIGPFHINRFGEGKTGIGSCEIGGTLNEGKKFIFVRCIL